MSLSNPREQSPVRKFFRVRASTGDVIHYDKALAKEVEAEIPFRFIVLDVLNTVGGFHEPSNSGIWSNEVRNSTTDTLKVRTKAGVVAEGPYNQIKDKLKALGGKFANSVYIAYPESDGWALGNINFVGASVSSWFDFSQGKRLSSDPGVAITGFTEQKKGRTEYFVPNFNDWTVPGDDLGVAEELDRSLQQYLSARPSNNEPETAHQPTYTAPPVQQPLLAEAPF